MKIKNYVWHGFGFPVEFYELPAIKVRGEYVPDVDFAQFAKPLVQIICTEDEIPLSGNQIKFIRNYLAMSVREFAKFMNVKHPSVLRWEKHNKDAAHIDVNTEIVLRLRVLRKINSAKKFLDEVVEIIDHTADLKPSSNYVKSIKPVKVPKEVVSAVS